MEFLLLWLSALAPMRARRNNGIGGTRLHRGRPGRPVGYFPPVGKVPVSRREESRREGPGNPLLPVRPPSSLKQPEAVVNGAGFRSRAVCVTGGIAGEASRPTGHGPSARSPW